MKSTCFRNQIDRKILLSLAACLGVFAAIPLLADVKPCFLFSDGAVLQREMPVPIWGTAANGERVTVKFNGQEVSADADDGKWVVWLKPMKAGGPFTMTISGSNVVEITNVLVGEVWICSGQSNMEMPVAESSHTPEMLKPDTALRLLNIPKPSMTGPVSEPSAKWEPAAADSIKGFSAVGYFFGQKLRESQGVPIGMINMSVGGTNIGLWVDAATMLKLAGSGNYTNGRLYDALVQFVCPYAMRGVLWYQGESDADRSINYESYFPALIELWRKDWNQGEFPFLYVQLTGFNFYKPQLPSEPQEVSTWAEIREVQSKTEALVSNVGMIVTTDLGDPVLLHAPRKREIGERLALKARSLAYGEEVECEFPSFSAIEIDGDTAKVRFSNADGGLVTGGGEATGFTLCGPDKVFHNAHATVEGDTVILTTPEVPNPVAARYGWANYPETNLFNRRGLPASPFRTDDFPLLKCPKCESRGGDGIQGGVCSKCKVSAGTYQEKPFLIQPLEGKKS